MKHFYFRKLEVMILTQNNLSGNLPVEIGNCQTLYSVRIGNNNVEGNIPKSVENLSSLVYFEANHNYLYGELVSKFSLCSNLLFFNLVSNGFTGKIPPEFGQLMNLQVLMLSGNRLFGDIPESILQCKNLSMLDLSNNRFNGTIPNEICNIFQLQNLLLGQNSIRGVIPHEFGRCRKLRELQLGSNHLNGTIPSQIGYKYNLEIALNLSYNHLHGPLPPQLAIGVEIGQRLSGQARLLKRPARLIKLSSLDVSNSHLSGIIPDVHNRMSSLIHVNLSNNQLCGPLPQFGSFQKNPSSYLGNQGLCGKPLNTTCEDHPDDYEPTKDQYHHDIVYETIVTIFVACFAGFIALTVFLVIIRDWKEQVENDAAIEGDGTNNKSFIISGRVFVNNLREAVDLGFVETDLYGHDYNVVPEQDNYRALKDECRNLPFSGRATRDTRCLKVRELYLRTGKVLAPHASVTRDVGL
uniref:Leucine-rich repeat-containing N-terminal plant-type domain-containing protein n=1 Tax=Glycine max TaxID=3847 RepID=K7K9C1_SOYBN